METSRTSEIKKKCNVHSRQNIKKLKTKNTTLATKRTKMVQPKLPKCASEVSSNWKALSNVLATQKKNKQENHKRKKTEHQVFKSKKRKPNTDSVLKQKYPKNINDGKDNIWFDDVDLEDIEKVNDSNIVEQLDDKARLNVDNNDHIDKSPSLTKCLAMDCEFVGIGRNGDEHMLARVSIVNSHGEVVFDQFVAAQEKVIDYRTEISGVRPCNLKNAPNFSDVQKDVANLIKNKTLVGHSITTDLKVLLLTHPRKRIRDTAKYKPFQERMKTKRPSLKKLAKEVLSLSIQTGEHSSVEDARVAMQLYSEHRKEWEKSVKEKFKTNFKGKSQSKPS